MELLCPTTDLTIHGIPYYARDDTLLQLQRAVLDRATHGGDGFYSASSEHADDDILLSRKTQRLTMKVHDTFFSAQVYIKVPCMGQTECLFRKRCASRAILSGAATGNHPWFSHLPERVFGCYVPEHEVHSHWHRQRAAPARRVFRLACLHRHVPPALPSPANVPPATTEKRHIDDSSHKLRGCNRAGQGSDSTDSPRSR